VEHIGLHLPRFADISDWWVLLMGLVAFVMVAQRRLWRVLRNVVTIAHEGGHAVVALLSGRKLNGITLHSDTSGLTVSTGKSTGPGMVFTLLAGYPAVSLLGLADAWLDVANLVHVLLWATVALLAMMLLALRNAYGVLSVVLTGTAVFLVSWFTTAPVQALCGELFSWFLLFGGIRPIFELAGKRRHGGARDSDADQLARLTGVGAPVWLGLWMVIAVAALIVGGRWLVQIPQV
jgi:hypothetical protein